MQIMQIAKSKVISKQKCVEWTNEIDQKTIYINEKKKDYPNGYSYLNGRESSRATENFTSIVADTESRLA